MIFAIITCILFYFLLSSLYASLLLRNPFLFQQGYVCTSKHSYSIVPVQGGVEHKVTIIPLSMMVPALTEASKGRHIVVDSLLIMCVCACMCVCMCVCVRVCVCVCVCVHMCVQ